jgi:hypothetical protein
VFHKVLIQRIRFCHQDDHGFPSGPAHSAATLPRVDHGARVPHEEANIKVADVNPHLQGARGYHSEEIPGGKPLLDLPPFLGHESCAVRAYSLTEPRGELGDPDVDEFRDLPGLGERDGAKPRLDAPGEESGGAEIGTGGGIHEDHVLAGSRCAASIHHVDGFFDEGLTEDVRITNGCGKHDELGL